MTMPAHWPAILSCADRPRSWFGPWWRGKSAFTFLQLQELEHQALIFQHMAAGVPVPPARPPIWKSVASSSPSPPITRSLLSVDPEPGRCRRTDGKKWRCSKAVVPNHKYCERHMHRGRHRSRKPAEDGAAAASPAPTPPVAEVVATSAATLSISFPSEFHLAAAGTSISGGSISPRLGFSPISVLPDGAAEGSLISMKRASSL
ncbi:unnamed protein product [Spirodela intermedia]|uniref:Growth-regulating factor n=1 Tax=Spirodela intermedia TaxID=51605 RepID=A0A7I8KPY1_SPIIN|nr:unnamed protein product [Spirodela intermedia]